MAAEWSLLERVCETFRMKATLAFF